MLAKIKQFVKENLADIILVIGVILISLLSFAAGYIVAKQQEKEPLKFEKVDEDSFISTFIFVNKNLVYDNSNYRSGDNWTLFSLEIS